MNKVRKNKEMSYESFKFVVNTMQVIKKGNSYIFGVYDSINNIFLTSVNSSPTSKELLSKMIVDLSKSNEINIVSLVPLDYANKLKRSGYLVSNKGFEYNFRGEDMIKYVATNNPSHLKKVFGLELNQISPQVFKNWSKDLYKTRNEKNYNISEEELNTQSLFSFSEEEIEQIKNCKNG